MSHPPPNRPTTPLRSTSRTSLRTPQTPSSSLHPSLQSPLQHLEPAFAELADSIADLESNLSLLALQHESVSRFTENFAAFLYGVDMNAYCVDWVEAPTALTWERMRRRKAEGEGEDMGQDRRGDETVIKGTTPKKFAAAAGADISGVSTASTRTTGSSTGSRLRTPARRSGIARGSAVGGRGGSRPGSVQGSTTSSKGGVPRGRAGSTAGMSLRNGRGRSTARGVAGSGRRIARGVGRGKPVAN